MNSLVTPPRDYAIVGAESSRAVERGLANGEWLRAIPINGRLVTFVVRSRSGRLPIGAKQ